MAISQNIKVAVDSVVFGYRQEELQLLLIRRKAEPFRNSWALPGGFVRDEESLEAAVERELKEEAGIRINYLEQLYTFGKPDRDPRFRTLSVAYYGLVNPSRFTLMADTDASDAQWFPVHKLPRLAFDHKQIIRTALQRLQAKLSYEPVGFELLDAKFLFSDLEKLYATLLGKELDRRNFRKKIMALGVLEQLDEQRQDGPGRPASLYRFDKARYFDLKKKGIVLDFL